MPLTVEEYRIGMMYMIAKSTMQDSGKKSQAGVEFVKNEPYTDNSEGLPPGQFTEKIYFLSAYMPKFITMLLPSACSNVVELAWNAYPVCRTIYFSPYFGDKFTLQIDSVYADAQPPGESANHEKNGKIKKPSKAVNGGITNDMDVDENGAYYNVHKLSKDELKERQVVFLDMCSEEYLALPPEEDPTIYYSERTQRGRWCVGFHKTHKPLMYAYKLVKFEFRKMGMSKVEHWVQNYGMRNSFLRYARRIVCWIDSWFGMSMEQIRDLEKQAAKIAHDRLDDTETEFAGTMSKQNSFQGHQVSEG